LVIIGGLAELFAGMISMGLGAWLAAKTDCKHYEAERERELREIREIPEAEEEEIYDIFEEYNIPRECVCSLVDALKKDEEMWVKVMSSKSMSSNHRLTILVHDGL
jgi:hypothetical protein